jgi:tetratricopeptide (TPR) repeat protein
VHLNVDSDMQASGELNWAAALGMLFVAGLAAAIWWTGRRRRLYPIAFGLIWFVVTELPTSLYPLSEVENDHRMFFAFPGLMLAVVWAAWLGVQRLSVARLRPVVVGCVLLVLGAYGWGVHERNRVWRTEESLWLDDVEKSPLNGRGLMIYGLTQMSKGEYQVALGYFERALVLTPNYPTLEINLGVVNGAMGRSAEAERHFLRAIALAPEDDQACAFYGRWLLQVGRVQEAADEERKAIALNPVRSMERDLLAAALRKEAEASAPRSGRDDDSEVVASAADLINRSLALNQAGKFEESIVAAQAALKLDGNSGTAWNNIAADEEAMHRWDEAIAAARRAIALQPDFQLAKNNLAWSESQKRLAGAVDKR